MNSKLVSIVVFISMVFFPSISGLRAQEAVLPVIPVPVSVQALPEPGFEPAGKYRLEMATTDNATRSLFSGMLSGVFGEGAFSETGYVNTLSFLVSAKRDSLLGKEGYRMEIHARRITITANETAGWFYGLQTLLQLLPAGKLTDAAKMKTASGSRIIPAVRITDYPRFAWRGLMLDVSRHFFRKEVVKNYIDQLAKYKFNVFHWHLSDDQGWRIEIKALPALTQTGAWRVSRTGQWWTYEQPKEGEKADYGGYYTQEDIREIVRYAAERQVMILPEIDVPGHSLALIATYPELSSTGKQYAVNPGSKFYGIVDNALCPGKERVFSILDTIFTEVAALFPGPYIHIGGDEAFKGFWKDCASCRKRMQDEHLQNVEELQSYFVRRLEKILLSKHKKLIGWDEILEGGLAPEATVMSWRGMDGGIKAAQQGHSVIMTPNDHCYLDLYQGDPSVEPDTYSRLRLEDCYNFEPVPSGMPEKFILGGQANLWTESVYNERHVQYMTWPRSLATAEVLWSPKDKRDWKGFVHRMEAQFVLFDSAHVNYARSAYDPIVRMIQEGGTKKISIRTEIPGLDVYYSFDNGVPDSFYPRYTAELELPAGATWIRVVAYRDGRPVGRELTLTMAELEKRSKD